MTLVEAKKMFSETTLPAVKEKYPNDKIAINQEWSIFTDYLCKEGLITESQYTRWPVYCLSIWT